MLYAVTTTMDPQKKKDRATQRRKRTKGLLSKAYQLGKLCDLDVAEIIYNSEAGQYYTYRSTDRQSWPPSMEHIVSNSSLLVYKDAKFLSTAPAY